jgi:hypothetical protein
MKNKIFIDNQKCCESNGTVICLEAKGGHNLDRKPLW